jgi:hypothetical protein
MIARIALPTGVLFYFFRSILPRNMPRWNVIISINQIDEIFERTQTSDILSARSIISATHFSLRIDTIFQ